MWGGFCLGRFSVIGFVSFFVWCFQDVWADSCCLEHVVVETVCVSVCVSSSRLRSPISTWRIAPARVFFVRVNGFFGGGGCSLFLFTISYYCIIFFLSPSLVGHLCRACIPLFDTGWRMRRHPPMAIMIVKFLGWNIKQRRGWSVLSCLCSRRSLPQTLRTRVRRSGGGDRTCHANLAWRTADRNVMQMFPRFAPCSEKCCPFFTRHHISPRTCLLVCLFSFSFVFCPRRVVLSPMLAVRLVFWRFLGPCPFWILWNFVGFELARRLKSAFLGREWQGCLRWSSLVFFVFPFLCVCSCARCTRRPAPWSRGGRPGWSESLSRPLWEQWLLRKPLEGGGLSVPCLDRFFVQCLCWGRKDPKALLRQWRFLGGGAVLHGSPTILTRTFFPQALVSLSLSLYPSVDGPCGPAMDSEMDALVLVSGQK